MGQEHLPFRQVHLDFHTSELIAGVGDRFDPGDFADTLARAHVNSITCFARCHHGYVYYDSKQFFDRRHPHLSRNLLAEQIDACHERKIRVPIYITVQWDYYTARRHPEWLAKTENDELIIGSQTDPGFYYFLCVNTGYFDFLKKFTQEVLETFPADGLFFDITKALPCCCTQCRKEMHPQGLDPGNPTDRLIHGQNVIDRFFHRMSDFVRGIQPDCRIFYNSGHVNPTHRPMADAFTHFEIESVPGGQWGYLHFPLTARYVRQLGHDMLGMTGRFHTTWGDFHSFKNPAALEFECFRMLALNAKCSIGDQLHPDGHICQATYDLIGSVYQQVEHKEAWCHDAKALTDIGVLTPEEFDAGSSHQQPQAILGATRMLQESAYQFDIIDSACDFTAYSLIVLPDDYRVTPAIAEQINDYVRNGGKLLVSYRSGMDINQERFILNPFPVSRIGEAPYSPDFIYPGSELAKHISQTDYVMYLKGMEVKPAEKSHVLAETHIPYFNRCEDSFCSHQHTPSSGRVGYPAVVQQGNIIYFAHPVFTQYHRYACLWCKQLVRNAIDRLLPDPLIRTNAPSSAVITLNAQPQQNRQVLHVLHYIPERRGIELDTIEDIIDLHDIHFSIRVDQPVAAVTAIPEKTSLKFKQHNGRVEFTLPRVHGHQMVEIQLA